MQSMKRMNPQFLMPVWIIHQPLGRHALVLSGRMSWTWHKGWHNRSLIKNGRSIKGFELNSGQRKACNSIWDDRRSKHFHLTVCKYTCPGLQQPSLDWTKGYVLYELRATWCAQWNPNGKDQNEQEVSVNLIWSDLAISVDQQAVKKQDLWQTENAKQLGKVSEIGAGTWVQLGKSLQERVLYLEMLPISHEYPSWMKHSDCRRFGYHAWCSNWTLQPFHWCKGCTLG